MLNINFCTNRNAENLWSSKRRLRDYANVGRHLLLQRVVIYLSAIAMVGAYYDLYISLMFLIGCGLIEAFDAYVFNRIVKHRDWKPKSIKNAMIAIYVGTLFSSLTVSAFCISVAQRQGVDGGHFLPMFMLVSAAIFAAMNNHQFLSVLTLRLTVYVVAILFIPIRDLWITKPPLSSEMWLNLFTILFVLGFIVELGRNTMAGYSRALATRKRLEQENLATKAALKAKTRFLATVSHELRTPLTSIKGAFDLINSGVLGKIPEKLEPLLDIGARNTNKLNDLVGDLLFLQAAEVGKVKLDIQRLNLGELIEEGICRFRPHAKKLNITIKYQQIDGNFVVSADKKRIDQVLMNLLSNAAKFSKAGGAITVALEDRTNIVRLSVHDNGIGIQEGSDELVFAEFVQLDSGDGRNYDGTGLGLSISKRIVEAHQGKIGYISELGSGSQFYIDLKREPPMQDSSTTL